MLENKMCESRNLICCAVPVQVKEEEACQTCCLEIACASSTVRIMNNLISDDLCGHNLYNVFVSFQKGNKPSYSMLKFLCC